MEPIISLLSRRILFLVGQQAYETQLKIADQVFETNMTKRQIRQIYYRCQRKIRHLNVYDALAESWRLKRRIPFKEFGVYRCDNDESNGGFHYHVGSQYDARDAKRILKRVKKTISRLLKAGIPRVPEELLRLRAQMERFLSKGSWRFDVNGETE